MSNYIEDFYGDAWAQLSIGDVIVPNANTLSDGKTKDSRPVIVISGRTGRLGQAIDKSIHPADYRTCGFSKHGFTGDPSAYARADVRRVDQVRDWFEFNAQQPYGLVTCAGIAAVEGIEGQTLYDFDESLQTNLTGTWICIKEAVRRGVKRIVTVGSILGSVPMGYPDRAAYIASKAAVAGLTRALAVELAPRGIPVNCVAPGHYSLMASGAGKLLEGALGKSPMGRLVTPEEVAQVVAWLLTAAPAVLTGQVIAVDGGYSVNGFPIPRWWEKEK